MAYTQCDYTSQRGERWRIEGHISDPIPAVTSGPPDRWAPAEGGEAEVLAVYHHDTMRLLPRSQWSAHGLIPGELESALEAANYDGVRE